MASDRANVGNLLETAEGLLALARLGVTLKGVPRTGWVDRGVPRATAESVADHSFNTALLAWAAATERARAGATLDPLRVLRLALIHDLAEAVTGDLPPYDPSALPSRAGEEARRAFLDRRHVRGAAAQAAKHAAEDAAMTRLLTRLPASVRDQLSDLWAEVRAGESPEARFVKQVDRLETFLQSRAYLDTDRELPVDSFRREVLETIDDPLLAAMRDAALDAQRPATE